MAKQPNPKKIAALIAATKAKAGGRPVIIRKSAEGPGAGMPGSKKSATLEEVKITATPIAKKVESISVGQFGGKKVNFAKDKIVGAFRGMGLNKEADALSKLSTIANNDLADMVNKVIKSKNISPLK